MWPAVPGNGNGFKSGRGSGDEKGHASASDVLTHWHLWQSAAKQVEQAASMTALVRITWLSIAVAAFGLSACSDARTSPATAKGPTAAAATAHGNELGDIVFVHGYRQGCEIARQQGQPMLVFFTAGWCRFCHAMAQDAFCQELVVGLSKQFTCVVVDADVEPDTCRLFRVRSFPTIQFVSPRGLPLNRVVGKQPAPLVAAEMQAALEAVARRVDSREQRQAR
jgi:thiol:disulfide interchange protein